MLKETLLWSNEERVKHDYWVFLPDGYEHSSVDWPAIVYLHGGGANPPQVKKRIIPLTKLPAILLVPICPPLPAGVKEHYQVWNEEILGSIVRHVLAEFRIDTKRCALAGFSSGGSAAWALPFYHPDLFSKVAVISGSCHFWKLRFYPSIPVWAFSGANEEWLQHHKYTVDTATSFGIEVTHTIWPSLAHSECRDRTLSYPPLIDWLLDNSLEP
ncbi:alpha/beta hydrolase-fold protein [Candidatus Bipolaricaulota bacterium]